jgi:hypothetical protein
VQRERPDNAGHNRDRSGQHGEQGRPQQRSTERDRLGRRHEVLEPDELAQRPGQ